MARIFDGTGTHEIEYDVPEEPDENSQPQNSLEIEPDRDEHVRDG